MKISVFGCNLSNLKLAYFSIVWCITVREQEYSQSWSLECSAMGTL